MLGFFCGPSQTLSLKVLTFSETLSVPATPLCSPENKLLPDSSKVWKTLDALHNAGCTDEHIYQDEITGSTFVRTGLDEALKFVRPGDTFTVWKLDRLGRSLRDLIDTFDLLKKKGVEFVSIMDKIDTTTPNGKLIFHIMGALAEWERDIIRLRTRAGLEAARARGRKGGRPRKLTPAKAKRARELYDAKELTVTEICGLLNISRSTFYDHLGLSKKKDAN